LLTSCAWGFSDGYCPSVTHFDNSICTECHQSGRGPPPPPWYNGPRDASVIQANRRGDSVSNPTPPFGSDPRAAEWSTSLVYGPGTSTGGVRHPPPSINRSESLSSHERNPGPHQPSPSGSSAPSTSRASLSHRPPPPWTSNPLPASRPVSLRTPPPHGGRPEQQQNYGRGNSHRGPGPPASRSTVDLTRVMLPLAPPPPRVSGQSQATSSRRSPDDPATGASSGGAEALPTLRTHFSDMLHEDPDQLPDPLTGNRPLRLSEQFARSAPHFHQFGAPPALTVHPGWSGSGEPKLHTDTACDYK